MNLADDLNLEAADIERCNIQLGLYAVHLATGHSVACVCIKAATIEKYLLSVAKFCARSNPRDPRKSVQLGKPLADPIASVLKEMRRWEDIPDKREPFTIEMWQYLYQLLASRPHIYGPDSDLAALVDFAGAGLYNGYRLSEWAQPNGSILNI